VAVTGVERLAPRRSSWSSRIPYSHEPTRVPLVLELEESAPYWSPNDGSRAPRVDSPNGRHEFALESAADSWELQKLGIAVSQTTVAKYMPRRDKPPSQQWRTFLSNHVGQIMAADFFVVPTVTYRLLFVLLVLAHDRRRIVHVAVTDHPTAAWTGQQLRNAFPEDHAPRYLLHDRETVFTDVASTNGAMQIHEVVTAPRSPWQNAYVERLIGSIRRECLDHVIVLSGAGLRRVLADYVDYYMNTRTHLSLGKDAPAARPATPLSAGRIVEIPLVNGLHHRYDRAAA
jgi:putative transposase